MVFKGNSVSVEYPFFAQSIAEKSHKTKEMMEEQKVVNRTIKNDPHNQGSEC